MNSSNHKGLESYASKMQRWFTRMKFEFPVMPHGPYAKPENMPEYVRRPDEKSVDYEKRKLKERESEEASAKRA